MLKNGEPTKREKRDADKQGRAERKAARKAAAGEKSPASPGK